LTTNSTEPPDTTAGIFSVWLEETHTALKKQRGVKVPCGDCNACCRSSYFIHIKPDETETLARIPAELLFPAPGQSEGTLVLGYDEQGHCPLLIDNKCSIYLDRPETCRSYDCRVFSAAGIEVNEDDKTLISLRTQQWKFIYPTSRDHKQHAAVRAAAKFLREHAAGFGNGSQANSSQLAIRAIKVYEIFL